MRFFRRRSLGEVLGEALYEVAFAWHAHVLCRLGRHDWDGWLRRLTYGHAATWESCTWCDARRAL